MSITNKDFYEDIRSTLMLYKILGLTSLKNVFYGRIDFQWGSNLLWPLVTYITPCYLLVFKAIRNPTATLWFWTVNFMLRELLSQLTSIYVDMRLPKIIENTNRFDSKYGRPTEQRTRPRYYVVAYLGCTFTLLACGCIDILLNKISAKVFYESILRYMSSIFPLLYLLFCDEMCIRFRSLRTRWRMEVAKVLASTPRITCQVMESERLAHAQLCDLVEEVRVAFGPRITTYLLFVFLEHLARFYFDTYVMPTYRYKHSALENKGVSMLESLMFLGHAWIGTYLVAYLSDTLTESSKEIITDLRNIPIWKLPQDCSEQVTFFMSQVQNSQTVITASGLFTVNKTILSSVSIIEAINDLNIINCYCRHSCNGVHKILVELILGFFWCSK
ncbi:uncharacterized protein LOC132952753 isoform X1 [Metopolophium dirhodum]|uniref:uncharacterized protein LOC132952753 isoform X1 n=1 Tax=Metopolophium dirhodum TaxID=44670 RepID=UPI0029907101|nr:uncharacterized protein LOC132952753 isoform X1 [Metopolophium dirhodum]